MKQSDRPVSALLKTDGSRHGSNAREERGTSVPGAFHDLFLSSLSLCACYFTFSHVHFLMLHMNTNFPTFRMGYC